jgi:acyl-CoA thioester hydrolase
MQEAAIEASAAAGYDNQAYQAMGRIWLIRETDIEYIRPLFYGDQLTVRTWVADFRKVRSRRVYLFTLPGSDEPAARAVTDWVFLDRESLRPAPIPEDMARAFRPEGGRDRGSWEPFRILPDPPPGSHIMRRMVEWRDVDHVGHVNNAVYLSYNEEAGLDAARARGRGPDELFTEGWGIFTRRNRIEYLRPALLGDTLEIETWLSPPRNTSITRYFVIRRAGDPAPLARAESVWVLVDLSTGASIPIPAGFLTAFSDNFGPD